MNIACIFDMDGLLFNTEELCRSIWIELCKERGVTCTYEQYARCIGHNEKDVIAILKDMFGQSFPCENFFVLVRQRMVQHFEQYGTPDKPGIHPLFDFLKSHQVPFALATSNNEKHARDMIRRSGLEPYFDAYAFGTEVPHGKPEPDIFLMAAGRLNTPPERCIVFEDSPAGLEAARRAGMMSVFVPDLAEVPPEVLENVTWKCSTLEDAIGCLKPLLEE
ncbi:MAG: HAD family phosphatase [Treponemataceae bacterium]|nr:HAD family phosphatase [Treponemataceae bacterium]